MKIKIYLVVMILVLFANICQAEMTGAQWLNFVSSSEPIDHIQSIQVINSVPLKYCECLGYSIDIPAEVTPGQLVKVVEKYLSDHPEMLHQEINYIICAAYGKVWGKTNIKQK
ncbi:hypothetical protein KKC04_04620 [Patescibacteria group bacterium]|nr:hypothetical protein [Patescibacteria group bacterium]